MDRGSLSCPIHPLSSAVVVAGLLEGGVDNLQGVAFLGVGPGLELGVVSRPDDGVTAGLTDDTAAQGGGAAQGDHHHALTGNSLGVDKMGKDKKRFNKI